MRPAAGWASMQASAASALLLPRSCAQFSPYIRVLKPSKTLCDLPIDSPMCPPAHLPPPHHVLTASCCSSLLDYVRDRKKLPEEEAVTIFQQLLHALQFCHRKDVSVVWAVQDVCGLSFCLVSLREGSPSYA